jgi:hypothetical protein
VSVGKLKSMINKATTAKELVQIIKENRSRFEIEGKHDPVVKELILMAKNKKGAIVKEKTTNTINVKEHNENYYAVSFKYDPQIISDIKEIPGRKWNPTDKIWLVPKSEKDKIDKLNEKHSGKSSLNKQIWDYLNNKKTIAEETYEDKNLFPYGWDHLKRQYAAILTYDNTKDKIDRKFLGNRTNFSSSGKNATITYSESEKPENLPVGTIVEIKEGSHKNLSQIYYKKTGKNEWSKITYKQAASGYFGKEEEDISAVLGKSHSIMVLIKAKYIKREGAPGNYKYYYTKTKAEKREKQAEPEKKKDHDIKQIKDFKIGSSQSGDKIEPLKTHSDLGANFITAKVTSKDGNSLYATYEYTTGLRIGKLQDTEQEAVDEFTKVMGEFKKVQGKNAQSLMKKRIQDSKVINKGKLSVVSKEDEDKQKK